MSVFINTQTLDYPRHIGDLALDLNGAYAVVAWVDPPVYDPLAQRVQEVAPVLIGDEWQMAWEVVALTDAEIAARVPMTDKPGSAPNAL